MTGFDGKASVSRSPNNLLLGAVFLVGAVPKYAGGLSSSRNTLATVRFDFDFDFSFDFDCDANFIYSRYV